MSDVFSQRNLPDRAEGWGREVEDRIKALETGVSRATSVAKGAQVVSVKSAEAADENIRQVAESVAVLDDAVTQRVQETLDLAVAELRESEKVLEAQFAAHDTSLAEAEAAIGSLEMATEPETMAAAVGVFIDAMMKNLTVTGVANVKQLVADELFAKLAVVDKLQALTSIITQDMIATGSITGDKMAANAISAAMVDVGQNAKWDSTGLRFFTPVAQGQQWDDWNSRQPLIELTPSGESAVRVSDGSSVTAGLTPSGQVWGESGNFGDLQVAGRDFREYFTDGPRGVLGITRISNALSINNTENRFAGIGANLHHGRSYEIQRYFNMNAPSSGAIQISTVLNWGSNSVKIAMHNHFGDGQFSTPVVFQPEEFGVPDGQRVSVGQTIRTTATGATGTLWSDSALKAGGSQFALFDTGKASGIWNQSVSAPENPVVTRSESFGSSNPQALRPDRSSAPDGRLTTAGYSVYGSDMSEYVYFPMSVPQLNGSTVNSAVAEVQVSYSYNNSWGTQYFIGVRKGGVDTNIASGTAYAGQVNSITFPAGHRQLLVGAQGMFVKPYQSGSPNSYGNWTGHFRVTVNYSK